MLLKDKVALVTGAARGIGLGIAQRLAAEGARVAIVDLDEAEAAAAARELGGAIGVGADASRDTEMAAAAQRIAEHFGGLDFFVNNAGGARPDRAGLNGIGNPFTRITQDGWDEQVQTNLRTAFAGCKAAIPHLQKRGGGAIVNIASIAGLMAVTNMPAYGAAKAGVLSLTKSLALELAPQQIRVNAICPGMLWTRAWETMATALKHSVPAFKALEPRQIFLEHIRKLVPMGQEQTPEDIGHLTAFLCGPGGRLITGQAITLDGGQMLRTGTG